MVDIDECYIAVLRLVKEAGSVSDIFFDEIDEKRPQLVLCFELFLADSGLRFIDFARSFRFQLCSYSTSILLSFPMRYSV